MTEDLLSRLERFYDAVPRDRAAVERHGTFELFLNQGTPYPFYARPVLGGPPPTAADLAAVRARQRELGQPESFEWVDQTTPACCRSPRPRACPCCARRCWCSTRHGWPIPATRPASWPPQRPTRPRCSPPSRPWRRSASGRRAPPRATADRPNATPP
ncbi:hypothetical protein ACFQY4_23505 [Catellatospora bangladeshensis]|uniref:hypothetical protein n=1 Tax=Catellatospora bangladeshensis TaxID=310355 RepID=UPI00361CFCE6